MPIPSELDLSTAAAYNARHAADLDADSETVARLVAFWQSGHGLDPDGKFGPGTRASATVPPPPPLVPIDDKTAQYGFTALEVIARLRPFVGAPLSTGRYVLGGGAPYTSTSPGRKSPAATASNSLRGPGLLVGLPYRATHASLTIASVL